MKRTIEEYKNRYEEYLSKIAKTERFSHVKDIKKHFEAVMRQLSQANYFI